jgi:DNA primase
LRFTDSLKPKHYTSIGDKIPYSPDHLLFDVNSVQSLNAITLCEGVFDAIALRIMGYPNPFAVLGSIITDYQMDILRNFEFDEIYCAFDNEYLNKENIKNIINLFPFVSRHNSIIFQKIDDIQPDPEEFLRYKSKLNQDLYDKYKENTNKWLLNVSNKSRYAYY